MMISSVLIACLVAFADALPLADIIGVTHWQGCYFMNDTIPFLLDGAISIAGLGTNVIKLSMNSASYPFNSDWPEYSTLAELAATPYFQQVFNNTLITLPYHTYLLVSYRVNSGDVNYWVNGISNSEIQAEIAEFGNFTYFLMSNYAKTGKTFVIQHWEGDWSIRGGQYNPSVPPTPLAIASMITWLGARQAGVDAGRIKFCESFLSGSGVNCSNATAVMQAANVFVHHATEVNLVYAAMTENAPDIINSVIPYVATDMVSYSSYDTQYMNPGFGNALDYITQQHNRTQASPAKHVYVGEYGVAQNKYPLSTLQNVTENVIGFALQKNIAYVMFWEIYCNEDSVAPQQRCLKSPDFNASHLEGFWLIEPNGTHSWAYGYLQGIINGSVPIPVPSLYNTTEQ
jgi:hypothetical protein